MFVASGAREQLLKRRRSEFAQQYLRPLLAEADKLGIGTQELTTTINAVCWAATAPARRPCCN